MPIYAYKCASCGHQQDVLQKISEPVLTDCPACGAAALQKQVTAAGFQLKGSGWYVTDFRDQGKASKDQGKDKDKSDAGKESSAEGGTASGKEAAAAGAAATSTGAVPAAADKPAAAAPSTPAAPAATS